MGNTEKTGKIRNFREQKGYKIGKSGKKSGKTRNMMEKMREFENSGNIQKSGKIRYPDKRCLGSN